MKLSIASYSFHGLLSTGMMDIFGYLETCKYRYHLDSGFFPSTQSDFIAKVGQALKERELVLANLCVDSAHIWDDDESVRDANYQNALAHLQAGEALDAKTIRIDAGGHQETWTNEQFDLIVKRYQEYAQRAFDNGYRIGPENHWGTEVNPQNMQKLCEAVDNPAFGVLLHFRGNAGDAQMAPWAMHTHISWEITENCLEESLSMLARTGYQGYWSAEHHTGKNEHTETAIQLAKVTDVISRW
jgi:hypothetical protein